MSKKLIDNIPVSYNCKLVAILFILIFLPLKISALENKILLKVNNEIITTIDIYNEIKYINFLNEEFKNFEKDKQYLIAKNSIIKDKIREIELRKFYKKIELEDEFIEKFAINYFSKFELKSSKDLKTLLEKNDINLMDLKKKISIQLKWNNLIKQKFSQNVNVNKKLIEKQVSEKKFQQEFLLSEIVFDIKDKSELKKKFNDIKNEIKKNGFSNAAIIYSVSNTSFKGGNIGWVKESSLSKKIREQLQKTNIGEITKPISIPGGFIILLNEKKRETLLELDIKKEIELIIKQKTNEQLGQFSNIYFTKIKKDVKINEF